MLVQVQRAHGPRALGAVGGSVVKGEGLPLADGPLEQRAGGLQRAWDGNRRMRNWWRRGTQCGVRLLKLMQHGGRQGGAQACFEPGVRQEGGIIWRVLAGNGAGQQQGRAVGGRQIYVGVWQGGWRGATAVGGVLQRDAVAGEGASETGHLRGGYQCNAGRDAGAQVAANAAVGGGLRELRRMVGLEDGLLAQGEGCGHCIAKRVPRHRQRPGLLVEQRPESIGAVALTDSSGEGARRNTVLRRRGCGGMPRGIGEQL